MDTFRVSPSCPPDLRVHVRGGALATDYSRAVGVLAGSMYLPNMTLDLPASLSLIFTRASGYLAYVLCIDSSYVWGSSDDPFYLITVGAEYMTNIEAEQAIGALLNGGGQVLAYTGGYLFPLCCLVLRNNGTTQQEGAILPVDMVNRGRSYIWRDLRPRQYLSR